MNRQPRFLFWPYRADYVLNTYARKGGPSPIIRPNSQASNTAPIGYTVMLGYLPLLQLKSFSSKELAKIPPWFGGPLGQEALFKGMGDNL